MPPACAASWRARHRAEALAVAILATASLAAVAADPAQAQADPAQTDSAQAQTDLPEVEIVAERPHGSVRAPAAETTVVEASKFAGEVRSVAELLGTAPGVSVHTFGGPGQAATLSLRGASADQSAVLLDGIPLQGPGGGAVDLATLPATLLDRIVVSRGVLGAQFGAGALGGAVELVPRAPGNEAPHGGATLSGGSFGTFALAADASGSLFEGNSAVGAVQLDRTAGDFPYQLQLTPEIPTALADMQRDNADARRISALVRDAQRLSPSTELDLLLQGSMGARGLPGPATSTTPLSRELDSSGLLGLRLRGIEGSGVYALRAWARTDGIELRGTNAFGSCADGTPDCPRIPQRSSAARVEAEGGLPLGGPAHWLRGSISLGGDLVSGTSVGAHRRAVASASLADDFTLGVFSVHPAVRVDAVGNDVGASPGISAAVRPFSAGPLAPFEVRAGTGLSFRAPTFSELYLREGGLAPNPDLAPERAVSVDTGLGWRTKALTVLASAFYSRYRDLIVYEQFPPESVKPFNVGAAGIGGFELQAVAALPFGFTAEAAYSHLAAENLRPGRLEGHSLSYRPPHRLFARLAHRTGRTEAYAETNFTSGMPRNQFDTAFLPSQVLVNAGAGARIAGPVWFDVEAKNLLDDRTLQDLFQYPLPGLSLAAIVRVRL